MNLKSMALKAGAAALAVSGLALINAPAQALTISFSPTGTSVDADPPKDILTSVGKVLEFNILLETFAVASDDVITKLGFDVGFDASELEYVSFTKSALFGNANISNTNANTAFGISEITGAKRIQLTNGFVASSQANLLLGTLRLRALPGLINDGNEGIDFATRFFSAINEDNDQLINVNAVQTQTAEVQPVPTPALLPGLLGMGIAAFRKRESQVTEEVEA